MAVDSALFGALCRVVEIDEGGATEHHAAAMELIQLTGAGTPDVTLVHKARYAMPSTINLETLDGGAWSGAQLRGGLIWADSANTLACSVNEGTPGTNRYSNVGADLTLLPGCFRYFYFGVGGAVISAALANINLTQLYAGAVQYVWVILVGGTA